jgi:hypothetical protein
MRGPLVVVTWAATAAATNIYAAVSRDAGATFSPPVRVNDIDGDARVNGEQAPRVAIGPGGEISVAWASKLSGTAHVRMATSTDGAVSFHPAVTVNATDVTGTRGWTSLAIDDQGIAHVAWLDGRNATVERHDASAEPMHMGMRQDIFAAAMDARQHRIEAPVAADVCFCCKTSLAVAPGGATYVAFRNVYPGSFRDIAVARSDDGGRTFSAATRVSEDGWQLTGCPEDGPSLAVSADGTVHVAWPTLVPGDASRKAIYYSWSTDGGKTFAPRIRVDTDDDSDMAAHPQIAAGPTGVVIAWNETQGSQHIVRLRRRALSSTAFGDAATISGDAPGMYPAVADSADGTIAAWTRSAPSGSTIQVVRARR